VSVWDIAYGKNVGERDLITWLWDVYGWDEEEAINEADDCLFFCFQSKYSEPDTGFEYLAKDFMELEFKWYCNGEFDSPISSQTFEYSNGKLDFQDVEEEEVDWDEDEDDDE
jgi:hypothetical protein